LRAGSFGLEYAELILTIAEAIRVGMLGIAEAEAVMATPQQHVEALHYCH
jgi:hypothetical protein